MARDPAVLSDVIAALGTLREKGFSKGHAEAIERILPTGTIARVSVGCETLRATRVKPSICIAAIVGGPRRAAPVA